MKKKLQQFINKLLQPLVNFLIRLKIDPNTITSVGFFLNLVATVIFIYGAERGERPQLSFVGWAGLFILIGGLFDILDGQLARSGHMSSKFGAFFDSVLDRYSEAIMFMGISYFLVAHSYFFSSLLAFISFIGSMMVSYTRARAEGLGIECTVGVMQRPERVVLVGLAASVCGIVGAYEGGNVKYLKELMNPIPPFETISILTIPVAIVAIFANFTAFQRVRYCYRVLEKDE
ncbi:MAG: CDP-alcohol phosphatidyltransferase family protein [Flavobacteriales bacterium]